MTAQGGSQAGPQDARSEELSGASAREAKARVELLLGVGDGTRLRPALVEEELPLLGGDHVHQENGRERVPESPLPQLRDVAPAEGSAEVPEEDDEIGLLREVVAQGRAA